MPEIHIINSSEIDDITQLGYVWDHKPPPSCQDFINQYFPGFQLLDLLKQLYGLFKGLSINTLKKLIKISVQPTALTICFYSVDYQDPINGLVFARTFTNSNGIIVVNHDYFSLPEIGRGQGIGKKILNACLKQYENIGVSKITVYAGLEDGGFVWAKAGFKATIQREMKIILNRSKTLLDPLDYSIVEGWYSYHYDNSPHEPFNMRDWARLPFMEPILRGSNWHGEIDLTNPSELRNFKTYVARKTKTSRSRPHR